MKKKHFGVCGILALLVCGPLAPAMANQAVTVDLSVNNGAPLYGATGWLYGLGEDGCPADPLIASLKPQVAAQKPAGGLQHPNGDVTKTSAQFFRNGGQSMQIYLQDYYSDWPYQNNGLSDYLAKIDTMMPAMVADPNHSKFVYIPLNEPDQQWYSGNISGLCSAWKAIVAEIKKYDANAKVGGINYSGYNNSDYTTFMTYAQQNNCLPDVVTWHELQDSFFTDWYTHISGYRAIEASLGISARPVVINEYGRGSGEDIPVPGNLVQYLARFENSQVYGCMAFWTSSGSLNDLAANNSLNSPSGGWWLYKWYGEMTGNLVPLTPPTQTGPLQGLATVDDTKEQAKVLLGGSLNSTDVFNTDLTVTGFGAKSYFGSSVHAIVLGVDNTGTGLTSGPYVVQEGDYAISGGQTVITVSGMKALSAYQVLLTPATELSAANVSNHYEAEYATLSGGAAVVYGTNTGYEGTAFVGGYASSSTAKTRFTVSVPLDGYYDLSLRYSAGPVSGAPTNRQLQLVTNAQQSGSATTTLTLPGTTDWNTWSTVVQRTYLQAGINLVSYNAFTSDDSDDVALDALDVAYATGSTVSIEAEASTNTLAGTAVIQADSAASGAHNVGYIGKGSGNTLTFNNVTVAAAGTYDLVIQYANDEIGGSGNYNTNLIDRAMYVSVNGGTKVYYNFRNTGSWQTYKTTIVSVALNTGSNTIAMGNDSTGDVSSSGYAPNVDKITIALPFISGGTGITYFKIQNVTTSLFIDGMGRTTLGSIAGQWASSTSYNQQWTIVPDGDYFRILNRYSGLFLDGMGYTTNGSNLCQWNDGNSTNQQWSLTNSNQGLEFVNRTTGLLIDGMGSTTNGSNTCQYASSGSINQEWSLIAQ
jgi:hypothetical protein